MEQKTLVYLADIGPLEDPERFRAFYDAMPAYRKEKIDRFRPENDKRLSLGAGILLQKALRDAGFPGADADVRLGENEKPCLDAEIRFNLSHSRQKVLCVISPFETGCDVERIGRAPAGIAERFFTPAERAQLLTCPCDELRDLWFCRLWTLKESFLKTLGTGMTLPLDSFTVRLSDDGAELEQSVREGTFRLYEWDFDDGYRYACCLAGDPGETPEPVAVDLSREDLCL